MHPPPVGPKDRLRNVPTRGAPLDAPVRIFWNDHLVPFIEADTDHDLAVTLGVVHAHLRLAQIEFMRRAARGRLAEVLGPPAFEVDRFLRTLHLDRAVPAIRQMMPAETAAWAEAFVSGINHVIAAAPRPAPELAALGVRPQPWTVDDLLAVSRLAAADYTWRMWFKLLRHRSGPNWMKLWQRMMSPNVAPMPSFAGGGSIGWGAGPGRGRGSSWRSPWSPPGAAGHVADETLAILGRGGSNSYAVSASRSASGGALIASDPHLPIVLPNLWLIVGYRSPSYHAVGLMIPGVPVLALGRNPDVAWGGTSLHAASSELIALDGTAGGVPVNQRQETIRVRWGRDRTVTIRDAGFGPILSDADLLGAPPGTDLALRWVGHLPTDEMTALLRVNRARTWSEFCDAMDGFAVPAQNMIYADAQGRVGQLMAAHLPRRPPEAPADLVATGESHLHWERLITGRDLPMRWQPGEGFVASANDRPATSDVPVGFFFASDERITRLRSRLAADTAVDVDALVDLQHDVMSPSAPFIRDALLKIAGSLGEKRRSTDDARQVVAALERWDGRYEAGAAGPLAFEVLVYHVLRELNGEEGLAVYAAFSDPWRLVREDLQSLDVARLAEALNRAIPFTAKALNRYRMWGDAHHLRLAHILGRVPVLGRRHVHADDPVSGGNETVMKTAHGFSADRHVVGLGANARHISDLADLDRNWLVLLGGQDGWLGSTAFADQYTLWRDRRMIHMPLRPDAVRAAFTHEMELKR